MPLRLLLLATLAACLIACAPSTAPAATPGEMTMATATIVDASTGATLRGDLYLDDQLIAKVVSTATFSLGPLLHDRTVRVQAPGYENWTVGMWRNNSSEASRTISGQ